MQSVLGLLGIFLILIPTGQSLSCTQCIQMGSSCTGPSITCRSDELCGTSYTVSSAFGNTVSEMYGRDCVPKSLCNMEGIMSIKGDIRNQIGIRCCETNNCTPPEPKVPALSNEANGISCPTCISIDSLWCHPEQIVPCSGNETMCLLQTNKIMGARPFQTALRGCATKSVCDIGTLSASSGNINMDSEFICTPGM